jgi:hypothetical protein
MCKTKIIAVLLMVVFGGQYSSAAVQTPEARKAAVKEELAKIPIGKVVEVKLLKDEGRKIKGRLLSVESESFEIQRPGSGSAAKETIAIADVESVRKPGMRKLYWVLITSGAALAVIIVVGSQTDVNIGRID